MTSSEEWRGIPDWPGYEASSFGRIRHVGHRPRRPSVGDHGHLYLVLYFSKGMRPRKAWVHRLVCAAFHGPAPAPEMEAAHRNGDPADNQPDNLRWATHTENEADKKLYGRTNECEANGMAKLTNAQALELIARAKNLPRSSGGKRIRKGSLSALAAEFGVTPGAAASIVAGRRWRAISQSSSQES